MQLTGIHHLTAISADAPGNKRFYTGTMGMRLIKKTVNQDDTSAYHLFYADALARPGTDLTFFDWPAPPEQRGTHSIASTGLRIAGPESFKWWKQHLTAAGVKTAEIAERDGRLTLDFEDPEGQRLSLIDDGGAGEAFPWEKSPLPAAHQVRGLGPITLSVPSLFWMIKPRGFSLRASISPDGTLKLLTEYFAATVSGALPTAARIAATVCNEALVGVSPK